MERKFRVLEQPENNVFNDARWFGVFIVKDEYLLSKHDVELLCFSQMDCLVLLKVSDVFQCFLSQL